MRDPDNLGFFRGYGRPWDNTKRTVPKRTWSGEVVYKRPVHLWTMRDLERIQKKIEVREDFEAVPAVIRILKDFTTRMLSEILWFFDDDQIEEVYQIIYDFVDNIFRWQWTTTPEQRSHLENLVRLIALKLGADVDIKYK